MGGMTTRRIFYGERPLIDRHTVDDFLKTNTPNDLFWQDRLLPKKPFHTSASEGREPAQPPSILHLQ